MLENLDFAFEKQYGWQPSRHVNSWLKHSRSEVTMPDFILGGVLGIDAIHSMRLW